MSRTRVADRAEILYAFLRANLNTPFTRDELLARTNLQNTSTTAAALRMASRMAQQDGLCLPVACAANGNTYCVTDVGSAAFDPAIHLGAIAQGVGVRKDLHDEFMRSRLSNLTPTERAMFNSLEQFESAQRQQRQAYSEVLKAMSSMRREQREGAV